MPEGAVIIREHTAMSNLFSCLWFNEVNLFTPRDQLSFGYVVYRLGSSFKFYMFPNCEYNSLFVLHPHTREHSSKIEWVKNTAELMGKGSSMKESRGGLGLWTPYPGDLNLVVMPPIARTSKAGWDSMPRSIWCSVTGSSLFFKQGYRERLEQFVQYLYEKKVTLVAKINKNW